MTREQQDKFKGHMIHCIIEYVEANGGDKDQCSDMLCELSKEMRSGYGNIFDGDKDDN